MKSNAKYYIRIAGVLLIICALTALVVAGVNAMTKAKIEENDLKKMNDTIKEIFGDSVSSEKLDIECTEPVFAIYEVTDDGELAGYAVHTKPVGFKGEIEMMVGFDSEMNCKSVRIISLSETPGLGSKVQEEEFLAQFEGGEMTPIAGATISSNAVQSGVDAARSELEKGVVS